MNNKSRIWSRITTLVFAMVMVLSFVIPQHVDAPVQEVHLVQQVHLVRQVLLVEVRQRLSVHLVHHQ